MKVYIITDGEYSDYSIEAVFLYKDEAERCRDLLFPDGRVETHQVGVPTAYTNKVAQGLRCWDVRLDLETGDAIWPPQARYAEDSRFHHYNGSPYARDILAAVVWAADAEGASKIANEKRPEFILAADEKDPNWRSHGREMRPEPHYYGIRSTCSIPLGGTDSNKETDS